MSNKNFKNWSFRPLWWLVVPATTFFTYDYFNGDFRSWKSQRLWKMFRKREEARRNVHERRRSKCFLWARGRRESFVGSRAVKRRRRRKEESAAARWIERFERESATKRDGGRKYDEIVSEDHQETVNQRDSRFGDCFSNDFISSLPLVLRESYLINYGTWFLTVFSLFFFFCVCENSIFSQSSETLYAFRVNKHIESKRWKIN